MTGSTRLNARLDRDLARKLSYIKSRTHRSTTEIVRLSIEQYYETVRAGESDAKTVLEESGFVGCAEGPTNLSEQYKNELTASLGRKLG